MKHYQYRAIHIAVNAVWGKPTKCILCNGKNKSKRFEWSSKTHKYTLDRKEWQQLCAKCHRGYDAKKFGKVAWNKGNRKLRRSRICKLCKEIFTPKRKEQIYCSLKCSNRVNGNKPKRLKKENLI